MNSTEHSPTSFSSMLSAYRPLLRSLAQQKVPLTLRPRLDASDLVQDTLLRGIDKADQLRGKSESEIFAWLKSLLRTQLVDRIRHHQAKQRDVRRQVSFVEDPNSLMIALSQPGHSDDALLSLAEAMGELPAKVQKVVSLRAEGKTFAQVAAEVGGSEDSVRMSWARAIVSLRKRLALEEHYD